MKNIVFILLYCSLVSSCSQNQPNDQEKFLEFHRLCHLEASEFVVPNVATGPVTLNEPVGPPFQGNNLVGSAQMNAWERHYSPSVLARNLVTDPGKLSEVQYTYRVYPFGPNAAQTPKNCQRSYTISVTEPNDVKIMCNPIVNSERSNSIARYSIFYEYGVVNKLDIRSFNFGLRDLTNGHILAEQKSYQLLLGGMSKKNRSFTYLGLGQNVEMCKLTLPDQFIKKAFQDVPNYAIKVTAE